MKKLSFIQNEILTNFIGAEGLRYTEARPEGLENDLYNYHLQFLVKKGFLEKTDAKYALTKVGKQYVAQFDVLGNIRAKFKASILAWVVRRNDEGKLEILYQERRRQPFFGDHTAIAGKILPGEKIVDAAKRKLKEESGLDGDFRFIGVVRTIRNDKDGNNLEDTIYHICVCEDVAGELVKENEFGRNYWLDVNEAPKLELKNKGYGKESHELLSDIENVIKQKELFYHEEITTLKEY